MSLTLPLSNLWSRMISFDHLLSAYQLARKGKRKRTEVANFSLELEERLFDLQLDLQTGRYQPGEYRQFTVYERKPRPIAAAPFRDRIVHQALMSLIEPALDARFYVHSYACRRGKGMHKAIDQYRQWARRYAYVLKLDIARYFPNIDHEILYSQLCRHIDDENVLKLIRLLIDTSPDYPQEATFFYPGDDLITPTIRRRGIPIGNLTSQFFANYYLNEFDYWIVGELGIPAYLRYVDDLCLLADSKAQLWQAAAAIEAFLNHHLRLSLRPGKTLLRPTREKIDLLGYQVSRQRRWLRNDNGYRFQRKLKRATERIQQREWTMAEFKPSLMSWIGHAQHAETLNLREKIFSKRRF